MLVEPRGCCKNQPLDAGVLVRAMLGVGVGAKTAQPKQLGWRRSAQELLARCSPYLLLHTNYKRPA
jgi:hypothetical protein